MKIAIVTETYLPFIAGVSSSTDSIARFLVKTGHQVTVISPRPVLPIRKEEKELKLIYTPSVKDFFFAGKPMSLLPLPIPLMFREIKKDKVDLVHIQEAGSLGISALMFAKLRKIPVVGALHLTPEQIVRFIKINPFNLTIKIINQFLKIYYNSCAAVMVPTQTFGRILKNIGVKKELVIVSNGVDIKRFTPAKEDFQIFKKYHLPNDKILFLYLGRIDKDKNIATIIKALTKTLEKIHLVIAGQGLEEKNLKDLINKLKVSDKISWLGLLPEEDLVKIYQAVDCFIIMSPYEVQSIVTLQAIACGLPVIASNKGALPELVHDKKNGFLIETYDFKTLSQKMAIIANHKNLREKFGRESRKIAIPHQKEKNLAKLNQLYINLTK